MKKLIFLLSIFAFYTKLFSQITTTVNPTIAQMQAVLQGNGVVVTGLTLTCPPGAYATFGNGAAALGGGLNSGILLTTGTASNVAGPPSGNNNVSSGAGGSALGDALSGGTTFDGCYINFMITPTCSTLSIKYVFASEEYPEFSTGSINDVFGFVISGPNPSNPSPYSNTNIAVLPVSTTTSNVVSIQNVNNGTTNTGPCVNCAYYVNNPPGLVYDGATTVLTASTAVIPCQTYTMTIGVWDDSDDILDSGVFLDVNGLSCVGSPTLTAVVTPSIICGPQTVTLTAGGGLSTGTYTWSAPASGGLVSTNGATVTANPTATTTYSLSYTDPNSCPGIPLMKTTTLTFTTGPSYSVSNLPVTGICPGQTATLTANGGAGTYTWTPSATLSSPNGSVVIASPTVATTYTVTRSAGGCLTSTVVTVNMSAPANLSITPQSSTVCLGQSTSLTASGGATYTWTASSGVVLPNTISVTVTPTSNTTYTLLTGSGTCTASAVASVSIAPTQSLVSTPNVTLICNGSSASLTGSGATTYTWLPGNLNTAIVTVSPTTTTSYTVTGKTAAGCLMYHAVSTVSVAPGITPTLTASSPTVCLSSTVSISVSPSGGMYSYNWSPASEIQGSTTGSSIIAQPTSTAAGVYTLSLYNGLCYSTGTITIQPLLCIPPTADFQTTTNDSICTKGCVTFIANTTGAAPMTYQWLFPGGTPPTSNVSNPTICYFAKGDYSVGLIVTNNYGTDTIVKSNYINVADTPSVFLAYGDTTLKIGQSTTISATGATYYSWYPTTGNMSCPTCSNTVVQPTVTTMYFVEGSNSPYCKRTDTVVVKIDLICGDFFVPNAFSPNNDGLNDLVNVHGFCIGTFKLQIFNRWGEKVFETTSLSDSWDGTFRGKNMETGVFVYAVDGISIDNKPFSLKGNITLIR